MKILIVNTRHFFGGGDSTYSFNLADLLVKNGHEVAFFAMQDNRNIPDPNSDLFVSNIDYRQINQNKSLSSGFKVFFRSLYSVEARWKFSTLLDRFSPDIIHLQNYLLHITPSILLEAQKRKIPLVWTLHDYYLACPNSHFLIDRNGKICEACRGGQFYHTIKYKCKKDSLLASFMAAFVAYFNRILGINHRIHALLTPSLFLKNKMIENGLSEEKLHHLPLFLPQETFWEGGENQGYFLFLGKLEPLKGINTLLEAARLAPEISVLLAGSVNEPLKSTLSSLLPENVKYLGLICGRNLKDLLHNSMVVVLPSIWYENQPYSILEAFASGKPVIASNLGGMTELVKNGERGLLVNPGDPHALADAMRFALANPIRMKEMGKNGRQYVFENHSPKVHYQSLMEIYSHFSPSVKM